MNQIFAMEVVTHQKAHGNQIPRCFEDVCDPTRVPMRVNMRVNRNTAAASRNNRGGGISMLLKSTAPKTTLLNEGTYPSILKSITGLPDEVKPKKVALGFTVEGCETEVVKELPVSFDAGRPLRKDAESILGRELTTKEAQEGFDVNQLIGKPCQVVVMHKSGAGGKSEAVVSLVLRNN
ncbi:MAG: hypothetical protein WCL11_18655 [Verrucomicrobiota bacterium]